MRYLKNPTASFDPLAACITRAASQQTYHTIQYFVDRDLIPDAYRAYAYFRWVDDRIDQGDLSKPERMAFINRQKSLIDRCFKNNCQSFLTPEEKMLATLIQRNRDVNSGLYAYIQHMMKVMAFDAERQGRYITQEELIVYADSLALAVTEALHFFIGHNAPSPRSELRYLAATAAHITHMLRDTIEDVKTGYYNIPREIMETHGFTPGDIGHDVYRGWVQSRVRLARVYFTAGKTYLAQVKSFRCRIAGYAYIARFEWVLDIIEREGYLLRADYAERKGLAALLKITGTALAMTFSSRPSGLSRWQTHSMRSSENECSSQKAA